MRSSNASTTDGLGSNSVAIGNGASAAGLYGIAIGRNAGLYRPPGGGAELYKTSIGRNSSYTRADDTSEVCIGSRNSAGGTLNPTLLTGVADPEQPNDAANKQYVDSLLSPAQRAAINALDAGTASVADLINALKTV